MADYAKKTVAELQEILKSRSLPSSGKKAELIARLNENDKQASVEDEPAAQEAEPAATAQAEQTTTTTAVEPTPATEPEPATQDLPIETDPATVDKPSPDTALADQTNYSLNLPTSSLDSELAKRKARAERFGTTSTAPAANGEATAASTLEPAETDTADAQALKNLERAKRFGTGQTAIGKLDEALPSESARASRKRGHGAVAEATELDDPGLKRSFANRGRGRGGRFGGAGRNRGGGGRGPGSTAAKPQGIQKSGAPAYTSDKDKLAAEARKKKFATA